MHLTQEKSLEDEKSYILKLRNKCSGFSHHQNSCCCFFQLKDFFLSLCLRERETSTLLRLQVEEVQRREEEVQRENGRLRRERDRQLETHQRFLIFIIDYISC